MNGTSCDKCMTGYRPSDVSNCEKCGDEFCAGCMKSHGCWNNKPWHLDYTKKQIQIKMLQLWWGSWNQWYRVVEERGRGKTWDMSRYSNKTSDKRVEKLKTLYIHW